MTFKDKVSNQSIYFRFSLLTSYFFVYPINDYGIRFGGGKAFFTGLAHIADHIESYLLLDPLDIDFVFILFQYRGAGACGAIYFSIYHKPIFFICISLHSSNLTNSRDFLTKKPEFTSIPRKRLLPSGCSLSII